MTPFVVLSYTECILFSFFFSLFNSKHGLYFVKCRLTKIHLLLRMISTYHYKNFKYLSVKYSTLQCILYSQRSDSIRHTRMSILNQLYKQFNYKYFDLFHHIMHYDTFAKIIANFIFVICFCFEMLQPQDETPQFHEN